MANEVTIPILPCRDIDEVSAFYQMLGFAQTYRQSRPNPYLAVQREDIELHFGGIPGFDHEESYGSCVVRVPGTRELFDAFAAGMRAKHGKLLVSGTPRMTRPRLRTNTGAYSGFSVIDPGGNWIRFFAQTKDGPEPNTEDVDRVGKALQTAVVLGDSHGDPAQATRVLQSTLARHGASASEVTRLRATVYLAELAIRLEDNTRADTLLAQAREISLSDTDREEAQETLRTLADLAEARQG